MKIRVLLMGKDKPAYVHEGVAEFAKRMRTFCQFEIVILKEERVHDDVKKILSKEEETLIKNLSSDEYLIVCDDKGVAFSTEEIAAKFSDLLDLGIGKIAIVVGSSHGLSQGIKDRADLLISLSPLTMNHQIVRLVLLEQLYRIFTILRGMKYHK